MQMTAQDDHELLARYAREGSETAFAELVVRYVNLVYSTARRLTSNPQHAQDITQAVFIILARKAGSLSGKTVISGWLYQTARLTAANFVRGEIRRERREHEAFMQSTLNEPKNADWEQITPLLDQAMGRLGQTDRNAIVLRYFQNKTSAEVGRALKLSEAAAHKRVSRALEKLRKIFINQGVTLSATALAGTMAANSVQAAPGTIAASVPVTAACKAAVTGSVQWAVEATLRHLFWLKVRVALFGTLAVVLAGGGAIVAEHAQRKQKGTASASVRIPAPRVPEPAVQPAAGQATIRIKLVGTAGLPFEVIYSGGGDSKTVKGVLPGQVAFNADGFSATINVQGPGEFGYEVYRNSLQQAASQTSTLTRPRSITLQGKPGGTGISMRSGSTRPAP